MSKKHAHSTGFLGSIGEPSDKVWQTPREAQMTVIWLRHGEKVYDNSKGPPGSLAHDPGLTKDAMIEIPKRARELIDLYGVPDWCITSPYLRTRETAQIMLSAIEEKRRPLIKVDVTVAEFLGFQQPYLNSKGFESFLPKAEKETLKYRVPEIKESHQDMVARCQDHLRLLEIVRLSPDSPEVNPKTPTIVWVVTHGIIISQLFQNMRSYKWINADAEGAQIFRRRLGTLEGLVLQGDFGKGASLCVHRHPSETVETPEATAAKDSPSTKDNRARSD